MLKHTNSAFRRLYHGGYWLLGPEAQSIGEEGVLSLQAYRALAELSMELGEPRFPIHSKFHMLWHCFRRLENHGGLEWVESPLSDSCQMDETFIGVISRYSRRVSPLSTVLRTYDVYFTSLAEHWRPPAEQP